MKSVKQEAPFQCTKCPKSYFTKYAFKAHVNLSHDKVKLYKCYFCSFATDRKLNMIWHMPQHTKETPYKCQYCCKWYRKEASVKRHKDGESCNRKLTYPLLSPCYFCGKVISTYQNLKVHMKMVHLKEDLKLCNLCCKHFSSTTMVNYHMRTVHLLERKHKCQLCSKRFGTTSHLNRHIQSVHTKEKRVKCYLCSTLFADFQVLTTHMSIHTGEKPLTCYFCRKDFSKPDHLSAHIRNVHTKERPFKCTQCPSHSYSTKVTLNLHVREKHGIQVDQ
jgi:KRAB domain-containing zinc finger protein